MFNYGAVEVAVPSSSRVKSNHARDVMTWRQWLSCTRAEIPVDCTQLEHSLHYLAQQDLSTELSTIPEAA